MSYTLRQVQPLLTKPELELFQASRAGAVKALTARQLIAKITRARALRDKYRDTYRRQTVATRSGPAKARQPAGGENNRTEIKADILAEVLQRFEAQHDKLEAKLAKAGPRPVARAPVARGRGKAVPTTGAAQPKRQGARKQRAADELGHAVVSARGAASTRSGAASVRPAVKAVAKKAAPATKKAVPAAKKAAKKPANRKAITGAAQPAKQLMKQVRSAVVRKQAAAPAVGAPTARRGSRTAVGGSASDLARGAVPTGMPAVAARLNPIKAQPVNKKIHASARGRQKVQTAKRDAR